MAMVERIAKALNIEPFRLFIDDKNRKEAVTQPSSQYLKNLSSTDRQDLSEQLSNLISNAINQYLRPEN
jgi:hypothetical protein